MLKNKVVTRLAVAGLLVGLPGMVHAQLVANGNFETSTNGNGQLGYNTNATGWSVPNPSSGSSYTFLFAPGTADTTGAAGQYGNLQLWGPGNGSANGLTAASPAGGNFLASDGGFQVGAISQTINGLTVGKAYNVSFYWGAAQQSGLNGATQSGWTVSLGSQSFNTGETPISSHGFSGWKNQTFTYTATSTSETLSFLAHGQPTGVPPFSLLDGVSMTAVPEPSAVVSLFAGVLGFGVFARRRIHAKKSVAS